MSFKVNAGVWAEFTPVTVMVQLELNPLVWGFGAKTMEMGFRKGDKKEIEKTDVAYFQILMFIFTLAIEKEENA